MRQRQTQSWPSKFSPPPMTLTADGAAVREAISAGLLRDWLSGRLTSGPAKSASAPNSYVLASCSSKSRKPGLQVGAASRCHRPRTAGGLAVRRKRKFYEMEE